MRVDDVKIRNRSKFQQLIVDPLLSNGRLYVNPGEEAMLPLQTYRRVASRIQLWAVNVLTEEQHARRLAAQAAAAEPAAETPPSPDSADAPPQDPPTEGQPNPDPPPVWTHLYKALRARVNSVKGEGEEEMFTVAVENGPPRMMKRATWEANAEPLPESETQENSLDPS